MGEPINQELSGEALLARYRTALACQPERLRALVRNITVEPHWFGDGDAFWYRRETAAGHEFVQVDPDTRASRPAFDHTRLAGLLDGVTGQTNDPAALPFGRFAYGGDGVDQSVIRVELDGTTLEVDLDAGSVTPSSTPLPPVFPGFSPHGDIPGRNWGPILPSPDGRREVFVRDHDLYLRERASGEERRLTHAGTERHGYGQLSGTIWSGEVGMRRDGVPWPVQAVWSPDSRTIATVRIDNRAVGLMHLLDSVNDGRYDQRPTLLPYTMVQAGDAAIPTATFVLFETESGRRIDVQLDPVPAMEAPIANGLVTWSADSRALYIRWTHRLARALSIRRVDPATGAVNAVLDEASDLPVEDRGWPAAGQFKDLPDRDEALWISNRDGWRHVYRLNTRTGQMLGQVTSGEWAVDRILHIDAAGEWLAFTARGREPGHDLYYLHLYRCGLDGSGLTLLTPEDADHHLIVSPSGRYLLDRYSRVDLPTVSVLRDSDGEVVMELERADIGALQATGWQPPERFLGLADDGETPIYGVVYRPANLEPNGSYPVIDCAREYGDSIVAPRSFAQGLSGFAGAAATAELGFITVNLDGRGSPGRSRAFHNASSIYLDATGLADHVALIRQLAERYPYIDAQRVGITGYSGGGYTAARAILLFPDFYRVAVSGAGNHEQRLICGVESEAQIGFPAEHPDAWARQANTSLVANLTGKLLLIHGELDDDVPPAASLQLADALLQAGKEFDFLIVPRLNHTRLAQSLLYRRKLWDYFVRHLHGVEPPDWNTVSFEALATEGQA